MSTFNTDVDSINHICCLVREIIELGDEILKVVPHNENVFLIQKKAQVIQKKAQKMEDRLKTYRVAIEGLGFKRIKKK